jgi:hypothetical protein
MLILVAIAAQIGGDGVILTKNGVLGLAYYRQSQVEQGNRGRGTRRQEELRGV